MVDISKLSRAELDDLKGQIDRRIVEIEKEQKDAALAELRDIAQRHGVTIEDMLQMARASASPTGQLPKYRDPENSKNTWTGRGRKPKWLVLALESGAKIEEFAI